MKAAHHQVWTTELPKRIAPTYRVANFWISCRLCAVVAVVSWEILEDLKT